jgi:hypothetical protein
MKCKFTEFQRFVYKNNAAIANLRNNGHNDRRDIIVSSCKYLNISIWFAYLNWNKLMMKPDNATVILFQPIQFS